MGAPLSKRVDSGQKTPLGSTVTRKETGGLQSVSILMSPPMADHPNNRTCTSIADEGFEWRFSQDACPPIHDPTDTWPDRVN
jgi:hypothetical protein